MSGQLHGHARLAAALLTFVAAALLPLAGCGGGSSETSSTTPEAGTTGAETTSQGTSSAAESSHPPQRKHYPPQHHFRGAEKDIEDFGTEANESESASVLAAEQGYLSAIMHHDYGKACSLISNGLEGQFQELVRSGGGGHHLSCRQILPGILAGNASHVAAVQLGGDIRKVRVEGEHGFVVFHAPGARLFVYPMIKEPDGWRVESITSTVLAPSAATLGEG